MKRTVPLIPTIIVAAAVATMVALGLWQLQRREWKEALIARYVAAEALGGTVAWPGDAAAVERALFRRTAIDCARPKVGGAMAGRNAAGESGWAVTARCDAGDAPVDVVLGWSRDPAAAALLDWKGGRVEGLVVPGAGDAARLLADPPLGGLQPSARPDPRDLPNNHLAYAVQWFFFAITAALIYVLALRKRNSG